ncbi:hypothetical protein LZL87_006253 [Fusarium oxysporum]|nr:hypothetical protein LZL87_006253 [Fusarium oxysporum]
MQFAIATSLTILAAVSKVSAWGPSSMAGVSCDHYIRGGVENKGCSGMFKATSVWTKENSNCKFYTYTGCRDYGIQRENGECLDTRELLVFNPDGDSWEYTASYRCQNTE